MLRVLAFPGQGEAAMAAIASAARPASVIAVARVFADWVMGTPLGRRLDRPARSTLPCRPVADKGTRRKSGYNHRRVPPTGSPHARANFAVGWHHHGQPVRLGDDAPRRRYARAARRRVRGAGGVGPSHAGFAL